MNSYHADPPEPTCPNCYQDEHECRCLEGLPEKGWHDDWVARVESGRIDWAAECDAGNVDIMSMIPLDWWDGAK